MLLSTLLILSAAPKVQVPVEKPLPSTAAVFISSKDPQLESDFLKALGEANVPMVDMNVLFPQPVVGTGGADLLKKAKESYDNLDYEAAVKQYDESIAYFSQHPLEADAASLAEAHFFVGVLAVQNGGKAGAPKATQQFAKALAFSPEMTLDANTYGNDLKKIFEKAKTEFANAKTVEVSVTSVPEGAEAKLGSKPMGKTPLIDKPPLKPGAYIFSFSKPGYETSGIIAEITADAATVEGQLKALANYAELNEKGAALSSALNSKVLPASAKNIAKATNSRFLIIGAQGEKSTSVELWDTFSGGRVKELSFSDSASMTSVANKMKNYIESPSLLKPVAEEPVAGDPVYKKWWFWAGVGAVVVGGGVAAGVVAANNDNGKRPFNVVLGLP